MLLNRWEKRTRENFSGFTFGFNFEKASTDPAAGCEESSGHHRIVKYVSPCGAMSIKSNSTHNFEIRRI